VQGWAVMAQATSGAMTGTASISTTIILSGSATMSRRRAYLQVHARRQVRDADRQTRHAGRIERHRASRPARRHGGRSRHQTSCSVAEWLRQQACHRVRCRDRPYKRHWAPMATGQATTRSTGISRDRRRSSSPTRYTASPSPLTGWSWSATASTIACSSSAKMGPLCARPSSSRTAIRARSARSSNGPMRRRPISWSWTIRMASSTWSNRVSGEVVNSVGRVGHQLGEFYNLHFIGIDSKGNVYSAEVQASACRSSAMSAGCDLV